MKRILFFLSIMSFGCSLFAQRMIPSHGKGINAEPQVTIEPVAIGTDMFTMRFLPNDECAYYYYVAMPTSEIDMWTSGMNMTVEQLTVLWGVQESDTSNHTWTDVIPNADYSVFALPFGSDSVEGAVAVCEFRTEVLGDTGLSVITIVVEDITESSALVTCTPNEHTAVFYDGLITQEYFNEIGQDSAVSYFVHNTQPWYVVDSYTWQDLLPNTPYYVLAIGKNALQEWGELSLYPFNTSNAPNTSVGEHEGTEFSVFPLPNDGDFIVYGDGLVDADLQVFSLSGHLCAQYALGQTVTTIHTRLSAGTYVLRVVNGQGRTVGSRKMVVR